MLVRAEDTKARTSEWRILGESGVVRAYRNLLKILAEQSPGRLGSLPRWFLTDQAAQLLRCNEIYVLEQVDKHVPVVDALDHAELVRAAEAALGGGHVDDFCFLYHRLQVADRPSKERIMAACVKLARRGNVAGIEQIAKLTGVQPVLDEQTAVRAYHVLIAAGRLGAVDYIRQLSGVAVVFDPVAVRAGVRALLFAGKYSAMARLLGTSGAEASIEPGDVRDAVDRAFNDASLGELAWALAQVGCPAPVSGYPDYFARLVREERFAEIPALFTLCSDAEWKSLTDPIWERLVETGCASALRFVYEQHPDDRFLNKYVNAVYRVGVDARDRVLVRLACDRGGAPLAPVDAHLLLEEALDDTDLSWIMFAYGRLGFLPYADPDLVQLFLAKLRYQWADADVDAAASMFGTAIDESLGRWLYELAEGRFEQATRAAAGLGDHEIATVACPQDNGSAGR